MLRLMMATTSLTALARLPRPPTRLYLFTTHHAIQHPSSLSQHQLHTLRHQILPETLRPAHRDLRLSSLSVL